MARICPCSSEICKKDFIFYFIIIDLFFGISSIIGVFFAIIALIYYVKDQNFKSAYFKFYAIFSLIISIFYTIAAFFIGSYIIFHRLTIEDYAGKLLIGILLLPLNLWMIYLSINLITVTFDDIEPKAAENQFEETLEEEEDKPIDLEANIKKNDNNNEEIAAEDSKKSEIEI